MKRIVIAVALFATMFATGCTNDEIEPPPGALTFAAQNCGAPESAPTPELQALAKDVSDYSTNASDIVVRMIEACTGAAMALGVDLGDTSRFDATGEWYAEAAS